MQVIHAAAHAIAEAPVWDAASGTWLYVDIQDDRVFRLDPADGSVMWRADLGRTPEIAPVRAARREAPRASAPRRLRSTCCASWSGAIRWNPARRW